MYTVYPISYLNLNIFHHFDVDILSDISIDFRAKSMIFGFLPKLFPCTENTHREIKTLNIYSIFIFVIDSVALSVST